jgi:RHS repeat-associated protein
MRCAKGLISVLIAIASAMAWPAGAQPVIWTSGTFTYDGAGNITATGADTYSYDAVGRLVRGTADKERTGALNEQTYTYDAYGNRLTVTTSGAACVEACGLPSIAYYPTNHINGYGASYDEAGNLKRFNPSNDGSPGSTFTYRYDGTGMLVEQSIPAGIDWGYVYTADDERIATYTGGGNWRFTLRDLDGKVLREVTAWQNGATTTWRRDRDHVYRNGMLLATVSEGGATEQFHLDHLGTPRLVTNASGATIGIHAYYPFGDELALNVNENPLERLKFTGHERDLNATNGNSLDYMHARYYSALQGRFLSVDPGGYDLERPQSWNRYAYCSNNPITNSDPDGREQRFNPDTYNWKGFLRGVDTAKRAMDWAAPRIALMGAIVGGLELVANGESPEAAIENVEAAVADVEASSSEGEAAVAETAATSERPTDFVVTPRGEAIPIPKGANGPTAPERGSGMAYQGGSGGNGMNGRTTGVRIMDGNSNQGQRVSYMNRSGQTVNPTTGQTVPKNDPTAHIPLKPFEPRKTLDPQQPPQ